MKLNNSFFNTKKTEAVIFLLIISSFLIDKFYLINFSYTPAWVQGYHLANLFKIFNLLDNSSSNNQGYLKDAEKIFKFRYQLNNYDYLYYM